MNTIECTFCSYLYSCFHLNMVIQQKTTGYKNFTPILEFIALTCAIYALSCKNAKNCVSKYKYQTFPAIYTWHLYA